MKLTKDQVKKAAKLASLPLSSQEEEKYSQQLSQILEYMEQLNSVDTANVEPTYNITNLSDVISKEVVSESLSQEQALSNSANTKNGYFATKGVFEED
mgnify:CR=1 FL=1